MEKQKQWEKRLKKQLETLWMPASELERLSPEKRKAFLEKRTLDRAVVHPITVERVGDSNLHRVKLTGMVVAELSDDEHRPLLALLRMLIEEREAARARHTRTKDRPRKIKRPISNLVVWEAMKKALAKGEEVDVIVWHEERNVAISTLKRWKKDLKELLAGGAKKP
jgi:hypothetical protein